MAQLRTSKGYLEYKNHLLFWGNKVMNKGVVLDNLKVLSGYLDKIDINWGPVFGTLIGIVRNEDFLSWKPMFDIYVLKEDEERFKDVLWSLQEEGFEICRYERRGLYYLGRNGEFFKVFVLHKICCDVRHNGGSDFIHEKYLQNTVKWDFKGISLNVPSEVDEHLAFQYGDDWLTPKQTYFYPTKTIAVFWYWAKTWIQDHLPDSLYYSWILHRRQKDFITFKSRCDAAGIPLPKDVQLENMRPRKFKRVLTVGVYDLLHKGHVELFRRARGIGDYLIVAVQDGDFILKYKPNAQVLNSTVDRKYLVKSIRYVDEVISYTDVDRIVQTVDFDVLVTGPDQCHEGFQRAIHWCATHGKEHIVLGRTEGVSSSAIKARISSKASRQA